MGKAQFGMQIAMAVVFAVIAIAEAALGNAPWGVVFAALAILTVVVTVFRSKKGGGAARQ